MTLSIVCADYSCRYRLQPIVLIIGLITCMAVISAQLYIQDTHSMVECLSKIPIRWFSLSKTCEGEEFSIDWGQRLWSLFVSFSSSSCWWSAELIATCRSRNAIEMKRQNQTDNRNSPRSVAQGQKQLMDGSSLWTEAAYGRKQLMGGSSLWTEAAYGQKQLTYRSSL